MLRITVHDKPMAVTGYDSLGRFYTYHADDAAVRPHRLAVVKALKAIGTKEAAGRLGRIKVNTTDAEVKKAATKALAELKSAEKSK